MVSEGDSLLTCKHISILNPPLDPEALYPTFDGRFDELPSIQDSLIELREFGFDFPAEQILDYQIEVPTEGTQVDDIYETQARSFVHLFFRTLVERVRLLPRGSRQGSRLDALSHYQMTANQASVVFLYSPDPRSTLGRWLFTGDADTHVFHRILAQGTSLQADYLKVPHHGSSENLDSLIVKAVAPKIAVVSHDNRKFGRAHDSHPHLQVIQLLRANGVQIHYTNDVKKQGKILYTKTTGAIPYHPINFT
jgi:hypothetical protein